jgi:hypothetical protein
MNIEMEILFLILGAILGTVVSIIIPKAYDWIKQERINHNTSYRRKLLESDNIYNWLVRYYSARNALNDLYDCRIGSFEIKIPVLTKLAWTRLECDLFTDGDLLHFAESLDPGFPVNEKLIQRRKTLGQRLFNERTVYLDRIEDEPENIKLHIKSCDYFQMFTLLASLEEETFQGIKKGSISFTPIRDRMVGNLETALKVLGKPSSLGCQVAVAIKMGDSYELLIHTRSHSTITYGGARALIPVFGMSPITGRQSQKNLIFFNFIKEYCEELFNYEELITLMNSRRMNPYWFYDLQEAREILELHAAKKFRLEYLGFGFDALNGSSILAILAVIEDEEYSLRIKQRIMANWEVAERTANLEPIEFIDYKSPKFEDWLRQKKYQFGSAFAISLAIQKLDRYTKQFGKRQIVGDKEKRETTYEAHR